MSNLFSLWLSCRRPIMLQQIFRSSWKEAGQAVWQGCWGWQVFVTNNSIFKKNLENSTWRVFLWQAFQDRPPIYLTSQWQATWCAAGWEEQQGRAGRSCWPMSGEPVRPCRLECKINEDWSLTVLIGAILNEIKYTNRKHLLALLWERLSSDKDLGKTYPKENKADAFPPRW